MAASPLFILGFSLRHGSVCWVILTEIALPRICGQAFSTFTVINWLPNVLAGLFTPSGITDMRGSGYYRHHHQHRQEEEGTLVQRHCGINKRPASRDYPVFCVLSGLAVAFM